ncbi:unnamed protein product, partial [Prorocentrum cordatum]
SQWAKLRSQIKASCRERRPVLGVAWLNEVISGKVDPSDPRGAAPRRDPAARSWVTQDTLESQVPICVERLPASVIEWLPLLSSCSGGGRRPSLYFQRLATSCFCHAEEEQAAKQKRDAEHV